MSLAKLRTWVAIASPFALGACAGDAQGLLGLFLPGEQPGLATVRNQRQAADAAAAEEAAAKALAQPGATRSSAPGAGSGLPEGRILAPAPEGGRTVEVPQGPATPEPNWAAPGPLSGYWQVSYAEGAEGQVRSREEWRLADDGVVVRGTRRHDPSFDVGLNFVKLDPIEGRWAPTRQGTRVVVFGQGNAFLVPDGPDAFVWLRSSSGSQKVLGARAKGPAVYAPLADGASPPPPLDLKLGAAALQRAAQVAASVKGSSQGLVDLNPTGPGASQSDEAARERAKANAEAALAGSTADAKASEAAAEEAARERARQAAEALLSP